MLFGGAVGQQRATAHRVVDTHHRPGGAATGGDLFHGQGVGDVVGVAAAEIFRHHHAQQAQFAHLAHQVVVDPAGLFPGLGPWRDLGAGEVPRHVADHPLLFGEFQILHCDAPSQLSCR
ncbi:hypothetical protein D9M71_480750 [compost metagenome]